MASGTMSPVGGSTAGSTGGADSSEGAASGALEKVQEARQTITEKVTSRVQEQADQRSTQVGEQVSSIATALKSTADSLTDEGQAAPAKALTTVTEQVENFGRYLQDMDGSELLHNLDDMARRRPWAVAGAMFGVGLAASRVFSASSRSRYESRGGTTAATVRRSTTPSTIGATHTSGLGTQPQMAPVGGLTTPGGGAGNGGY